MLDARTSQLIPYSQEAKSAAEYNCVHVVLIVEHPAAHAALRESFEIRNVSRDIPKMQNAFATAKAY